MNSAPSATTKTTETTSKGVCYTTDKAMEEDDKLDFSVCYTDKKTGVSKTLVFHRKFFSLNTSELESDLKAGRNCEQHLFPELKLDTEESKTKEISSDFLWAKQLLASTLFRNKLYMLGSFLAGRPERATLCDVRTQLSNSFMNSVKTFHKLEAIHYLLFLVNSMVEETQKESPDKNRVSAIDKLMKMNLADLKVLQKVETKTSSGQEITLPGGRKGIYAAKAVLSILEPDVDFYINENDIKQFELSECNVNFRTIKAIFKYSTSTICFCNGEVQPIASPDAAVRKEMQTIHRAYQKTLLTKTQSVEAHNTSSAFSLTKPS